MEGLENNLDKKTYLLKKIGHDIAGEMSKSLQILTKENIKVEFTGIQSFEQSTLVVDVGEKCFGSYVNFRNQKDGFGGITMAVFPLSSTRSLTESIMKSYFKKGKKKSEDHELKLSAFKEGIHILLMSYLNGLANSLGRKIEAGIPKFTCFQNLEFVKHFHLSRLSDHNSPISAAQFRIILRRSEKSPSILGSFMLLC